MKYLVVYGFDENDFGNTELYPTLEDVIFAIYEFSILHGLLPGQFRIYELKQLK